LGKRRARITIEVEEIVVARRTARPLLARCPKCEAETEMVTLSQAALIHNVDRSAMREWMLSGQLHVLETSEHGLLICVKSLAWQR
jgi:hypothetical protein